MDITEYEKLCEERLLLYRAIRACYVALKKLNASDEILELIEDILSEENGPTLN